MVGFRYLQRCTGKVGRLSENIVCPFLLFLSISIRKSKVYSWNGLTAPSTLSDETGTSKPFSAKRCWPWVIGQTATKPVCKAYSLLENYQGRSPFLDFSTNWWIKVQPNDILPFQEYSQISLSSDLTPSKSFVILKSVIPSKDLSVLS